LIGTDFTAERIVHARQCLRTVLDNWDAADLAQGERCRELVQESIMDLQAVESHLLSGSVAVPGLLSSSIRDLKHEIAQIVRLVDAGLAFYRGLALRMGCCAPPYGPGGQVAEDFTAMGLHGMQG
jgi:hypothetical protein